MRRGLVSGGCAGSFRRGVLLRRKAHAKVTKVYVVARRLKVGDGEVVLPLFCESRKEDALSKAVAINQGMRDLLECHLVKPKGADEGEDTGIRLGQYLADLGISGFKSEVQEVEVQGSAIQIVGPMPSGTPIWRS